MLLRDVSEAAWAAATSAARSDVRGICSSSHLSRRQRVGGGVDAEPPAVTELLVTGSSEFTRQRRCLSLVGAPSVHQSRRFGAVLAGYYASVLQAASVSRRRREGAH